MTSLYHFLRSSVWTFLLAVAAVYVSSPSLAHAQNNGPHINECFSQTLTTNGADGNTDIEGTSCIYGDINGLDAYVQVDDGDYNLEYESGPDYPFMGAQVQFYGTNNTLAYDSGLQVGGASAYASGSIVPTADESYNVQLSANVEYCPGNWDCGSWQGYPMGDTVVVTSPGTQGYVDPKFIVVGVTYAPPGPAAGTAVSYQNTTFTGVTNSLSLSFSNGSTQTVSLSHGFSLLGVINGTITNTQANTVTQATNSTQTVTTSVQVQNGETTHGTGDYFAPVNNDYDQIWVWLNPAVIFTVGTSTVPVWNGYGYDESDQNGPEIVPIPLGYLNGHFGPMPPDIQTSINRSWAANQVWPAGQGPALTSADLAQIATADPFSVSTYGTNFLGYAPPSPSTSDNRFTVSLCNGQSGFNYLQADPSGAANSFACTLTYVNLTTQARSITNTYSQTYSTSAALTGGKFLTGFSGSLMNSNTLTWTTMAQNSITNSATSTAQLSGQGPPCNNAVQGVGPCIPVYDSGGNQPVEYEVFQDNMYGTFMFAPVHYY